jgi:hypothetical protein
MKAEPMDMGTWNISTMLKAGKMHETADQTMGSQL